MRVDIPYKNRIRTGQFQDYGKSQRCDTDLEKRISTATGKPSVEISSAYGTWKLNEVDGTTTKKHDLVCVTLGYIKCCTFAQSTHSELEALEQLSVWAHARASSRS